MEFRKQLCNVLRDLMKQDERICLLDADLSRPNGTFPLYEEFPNRTFNAGIAEANMVGVAAGLAAYGMIPVVVTFTPFATRRVYDQIAVSVAYAKQHVVIIGTDPGITAELNGGTHMSFEDVSIMRAIPTMKIYDAVDAIQLKSMLPQLIYTDGPVYIRMPRKERPDVFSESDTFTLGKANIIKEGKDITILATGTMVYEAKEALKQLEEIGIDAELISINMIKPLDEETILKSIKKTKHVITCENNNVIGGLYEAVCSLTATHMPINVKCIGVKDKFGQVGKYKDLLKAYELTPEDIVKAIKQ